MRFFNIVYWLSIVISPVIIGGFLILAVSPSGRGMIAIISLSAVTGIGFAEYVRRKIGIADFFAGKFRNRTREMEEEQGG